MSPHAGADSISTFEAPTRDLSEKSPVLDEDPPTTKNRVGRIKDDLDAFFLSKNSEDFQCPKCGHTQNRANAGGSQLSRSRSQELFKRADLRDCNSKLFVEDAWGVEEDSVQLSQKVSSTDDYIFGAFDVLLYGILGQVGVNSQQALQCHEVRVLIENFRTLCIQRTTGSANMENSAQVKIADQMITGFIEWMSSIGQILRNVEQGKSLDQQTSFKDTNNHLTLALVAHIENVHSLESSSGTKNDFQEVKAIFQHLCSLMATMQGLMINQPRRSFYTSSGVLKVETSEELSNHFEALKDGITQLQFEMKEILAEAMSELDELIFDLNNLQDNPAKPSNKVAMAYRKVSSVISCVANGVQLRLREIVQEKFEMMTRLSKF